MQINRLNSKTEQKRETEQKNKKKNPFFFRFLLCYYGKLPIVTGIYGFKFIVISYFNDLTLPLCVCVCKRYIVLLCCISCDTKYNLQFLLKVNSFNFGFLAVVNKHFNHLILAAGDTIRAQHIKSNVNQIIRASKIKQDNISRFTVNKLGQE